MDINLITKLAAAGAMGVSVFCIIKVYELLKTEQKEENPRPHFIKSIYVFMAFAILMTVISLGIEVARYQLNPNEDDLAIELQTISNKGYYSLNKNGNPEPISINYNGETHSICKALPDSCLNNCELKLKSLADNRHVAIKKTATSNITFGYITSNELKSKAKPLLPTNYELSSIELWTLGMANAPIGTTSMIQYNPTKNQNLCINYLSKLIKCEDKDINANKEKAIKILTQPELMNRLKTDQYETLIKALESGYRASPWDKYELAQVYLSRSWQTWNKENALKDKNNYKQLLADYKTYYENNIWIRDTSKYSNEYKWYLESKTL